MKMFPTNKIELIENLKEFSKNKLVNYSFDRNYDYGPPHENVSRLSPYLRRRFISEEDVIGIVLKNHRIKKIEKFIEEIFWRTYWRGWLETHPWVYDEYVNNSEYFIPTKTQIKCFDHWVEELMETGYLHNHSRMWFASIWIFTLGLSWQSGARFFEKNLLDFCPASNTLGWRWVAGIQTIGKPYVATAENIKKFTNDKFNPKDQLNENVMLNLNNFSNGSPLKFEPINYPFLKNKKKIGLILNNNDLSLHKIFEYKGLDFCCCLFSKKHENQLINNFQNLIFDDICNNQKEISICKNFDEIFKWIKNKKIEELILPYETVGNKIFSNSFFLDKIKNMGVNYFFYLREWDKNAFPYCTKGFFKFKVNINHLIEISKFN